MRSLPVAPLTISLGLFIAAAAGGIFLASFHLRRKRYPRIGLLVHATAAVSGFAVLAAVALGFLGG
jgi:hypothetical protein